MFAGLSFRQQERRRYRMVDEGMAENDLADVDDELPFGEDAFDSNPFVTDHFAAAPPPDRDISAEPWQQNDQADRGTGRDAADDDFWPTSLP